MDLVNLGAQLNAATIWPEAVLLATILVILVGDLIQGRSSSAWTPYIAMAGGLGATVALVLQWSMARK